MAHAAAPPPSRWQRSRILGLVVVTLGVILLVVTIISLNRPGQKQAARITGSTSTSATPSVAAGVTPTPATSGAVTTPKSTPRPSASSSLVATTGAGTAVAQPRVPLIVDNNTGATGLAQTAASRFEANGWTVTGVENFSGDILSTCAYYDPSDDANRLAALELQKEFPAIQRVKERFDGLPAGPIVVMLTSDYS